jgi:hypothetical protein
MLYLICSSLIDVTKGYTTDMSPVDRVTGTGGSRHGRYPQPATCVMGINISDNLKKLLILPQNSRLRIRQSFRPAKA